MTATPAPAPSRENPQREFIRHTIDVPLEVETLGDRAPRREHSLNVSSGGLAFRTAACPRRGAVLRLRIPTVQPPFEATGRVAWCRPEEDAFLVGVQFLDAGAAFRSRMVQQVCSIEKYRLDMEQEGRSLSTQEAAAEWIARFAGRFPDSEVVSSGAS